MAKRTTHKLDWGKYAIPAVTAIVAAFGSYYAVKERVAVLEERVSNLKDGISALQGDIDEIGRRTQDIDSRTRTLAAPVPRGNN